MDLWKIGFSLVIMGIAIPVGYAIYQFALEPIGWYWALTIMLMIAGVAVLLIAAIMDRLKEVKPEEKY